MTWLFRYPCCIFCNFFGKWAWLDLAKRLNLSQLTSSLSTNMSSSMKVNFKEESPQKSHWTHCLEQLNTRSTQQVKKKECHAEFQSVDELTLHEDGTCFTEEPMLGGETMYDLCKKIYIEEFGIRDRTDINHEPNKGPLYHMEPLPEPSLTDNLLSLAKSTSWSSPEATMSQSLKMGFALPNYFPSHKNKITPLALARSYVEISGKWALVPVEITEMPPPLKLKIEWRRRNQNLACHTSNLINT